MQSFQADFSSVLVDRRDDVERHSQGAATVFQRDRGRRTPLHRLQDLGPQLGLHETAHGIAGRAGIGRDLGARQVFAGTPCAKGDQTIWEMPLAAQTGMTASSGLRQSREYCGWLDTKRSVPATANALSICCGDHSLKPM